MKIENNTVSTKATEVEIDFSSLLTAPVGLPAYTTRTGTGKVAGLTPAQIVARQLTFINCLGFDGARQYAKNGRVSFGALGILTDVKCISCGDTHGIPNKHGNGPDWNIERLALSPVYATGDNQLVVVSETCSWKKILPLVKSKSDMGQYDRFVPYFTKIKTAAQEREAKREAYKARR